MPQSNYGLTEELLLGRKGDEPVTQQRIMMGNDLGSRQLSSRPRTVRVTDKGDIVTRLHASRQVVSTQSSV